MQNFDVAIIGSGPSGAVTALKLAEKGISTVIIEKEILPRHKTCGGGVSFRGRRFLPLDIAGVVEKEFHEMHFYFSTLDMHLVAKRDRPIVSMVVRQDFDKMIVDEAVKKGATLLEGNKLTGLQFENDGVILQLAEQKIAAKMVVAADGALSPTAKMAGWTTDTRKLIPALEYDIEVGPEDWERLSHEVRFDIDYIPTGYAWCFPKKNHLNIGVGCNYSKKVNMRQYCHDYIKFLGIENVISEKSFGYQIPVSVRTDGFVKNNVFLIGDAAGFGDPITAEGISNAVLSGLLVAEAVVEGGLNIKKVEKLYLAKLDEQILPELKTSNFLAKWFYNHTSVRNFFLKRSPQKFFEFMIDIFMGDKNYPKDAIKLAKKKLKSAVFS